MLTIALKALQLKTSWAAAYVARKIMKRLVRDCGGGVYTLTAVVMPVLLGVSALGVDASLWYLKRRELQTVVDNGAIAGAYLAAANASEQDIVAAVVDDASHNGFLTSDISHNVTVHSPPLTGGYIGEPGHVEVIVTATPESHFITAFIGKAMTVTARAVGGPTVMGDYCIIALDHSANDALNVSGTADVTSECGAASNSASSSAINIQGNATLTAGSAQAYGDIQISGNASLVTDSPYHALSQRVPDPMGPEGLDLQLPPSGSCDHSNVSTNNSTTLSPGRYCGGLDLKGDVTLEPGTYIIDGGDMVARGNATLTGDGVTFIFTGDSPGDVGVVDFAGGTTANLIAPSMGQYAGVLFYQDPNADLSGTNRVTGGSTMNLEGIMYFPSKELLFTGGSGATDACVVLVARTVSFEGNGYIGNDAERCEDLNISKLSQLRIKLVE